MQNASMEWLVETVEHEHDDIADLDHYRSYAEVKAATVDEPGDDQFYRIGLVRTTDGGDRSWAYMENGTLPERFSDAYGNDAVKVPARYHGEVASAGAAS